MSAASVTGWALRTPLGDDVDGVMRRLAEGARAAAPLTRFDAATYACRWAAAIDAEPAPSRHRRFLRRMGAFAIEVAREAVAAARPGAAGPRLGLYFGYGGLRAHWNEMMPALANQEPDGGRSWERGLELLHPFWMLQNLSNNAHALAALELGARGDGLLLAGANAGAQALGAAGRALAVGVVDAAVVVAYDTLLEPETLVELAGRGAYAGGGDAPPPPYGLRAAGFVPGEAAAAVVLERADDVGRRALVRVQAWAAADGRSNRGRLGALENVLTSAMRGQRPEAVGVVDGAAVAEPAFDAEERRLLAARPAWVSAETPICATLAAMGQLGAAASVVQTIALGAALRAGRLPPVPGLEQAVPGPLRPLLAPEPSAATTGLALATGAPGLAGAVRVELP